MKVEKNGSSVKIKYDDATLILIEIIKRVSVLEKTVYNLEKELMEIKNGK